MDTDGHRSEGVTKRPGRRGKSEMEKDRVFEDKEDFKVQTW
jgi:hypothetical protein